MTSGERPIAVLFLDANILISAAWREGTEIAKIWQLPRVKLVTSDYVIGEVLRNLPLIDQIARLRGLMRVVQVHPLEEASGFPQEIDLPLKDRPVLAGAIQVGADYLISGDKKHFGPFFGRTIQGVRITAPSEILSILRLPLP